MKSRQTSSLYEGYDTRIDWHSPELATLIAAGALPPGRVLDIGCGHGTESLFLAEMGWKVLGLDLDEDGKALRLARERKGRLPKKAQANLRFARTDLLQFREGTPGTFDVVIDRLLVVNLSGKSILQALHSVAYALREGGVFVLRLGIAEHPAPPEVAASEFFSKKACSFLQHHFNFDASRSTVIGYQGLTTPYQESGFLVTSSQAMGIMLLHRNGEPFTENSVAP
jgi:SAM-dependent methyltransferase